MKILYVHGFGSHFDPTHSKIKILGELGTVVGVDVEYCKGFEHSYNIVFDAVLAQEVDLIIGTSMGGYIAAHVGAKTGTPFVALNPATIPSVNLQKWVGNFTDFSGNDHCLTDAVVEGYPEITTDGWGLVIVESGDEIINASDTVAMLENNFQVVKLNGGGHRFVHMELALPIIREFYSRANTSYGSCDL